MREGGLSLKLSSKTDTKYVHFCTSVTVVQHPLLFQLTQLCLETVNPEVKSSALQDRLHLTQQQQTDAQASLPSSVPFEDVSPHALDSIRC